MREIWIGEYAGRKFRVVVNFGKIVVAEGLPWALGLRIRPFKRTVWKLGGSYVEREIDVRPPMATYREEGHEESQTEGAGVDEGHRSVSSMQNLREPESPVHRVRLSARRGNEVTTGMALKKALRIARKLGCVVHTVKRSGEVRIYHTEKKKRLNINHRRKSAPRVLTTFLTQLITQEGL